MKILDTINQNGVKLRYLAPFFYKQIWSNTGNYTIDSMSDDVIKDCIVYLVIVKARTDLAKFKDCDIISRELNLLIDILTAEMQKRYILNSLK
jgi:hypothetical protein